jgi:hypothetical protein
VAVRTIARWFSFIGAAAVIAAALWGGGLTAARFADDTPAPAEPKPRSALTSVSSTGGHAPAEASIGVDAVLPPTPRRLFLVATTPGRSIYEGAAQVGTDPRHPQTYTGGALLANGAQLTEIHKTHVVLERDGKKFELHLDGAKRGSSSELAMLGGPTPVAKKEVTMVDDRLSGVIRSMPFYDGDVLVGVQVFAGQKAGTFQQLGLRSGDIIVALDGAPVADANDALSILRTLADGISMAATVRRQNTTTTIALDGALLGAAAQPQTAVLTGAMTR